MQSHILVVEDDPYMTKLLAFLLADAGYRVTTLADPRQVAPLLAADTVALALLDVMLPHIDGLALAAAIRHDHPDLPIIFLSARGAVGDRVRGFAEGGDDYIAKPFEPQELVARIRALLRRVDRAQRNQSGMAIAVGDATLDLGELQFRVPGRRPVSLTPTEMKLLECLMRNAGAVLSRETLIARTWGYGGEGEVSRINVYINRLRSKIEADPVAPEYLQTARGYGYVFRAPGGAVRGGDGSAMGEAGGLVAE